MEDEALSDVIPSASLTVICSDCPRNGKTLFAKLNADLLTLRNGALPFIFDTDEPAGQLIHHYNGLGRIVDLSKTTEQVALFDGMLAATSQHFIVDLAARHFNRFFDIYRDIGFQEEALNRGLDVRIYFLIDRTGSSIEAASKLTRSLRDTKFIPVRNGAIGDALLSEPSADLYRDMRHSREILLPQMSVEALEILEHVDFHFDAFVAGQYEHFPFEIKTEIWDFLEGLYEQRKSEIDGVAQAV